MNTLNIQKLEGSARPAASGATKALVIGPASGGIKQNTVYTFASPGDIEAAIGLGPATMAAQLMLSRAPSGFGSVDVIVSSGSVAGTQTVVSTTSPAITFTSGSGGAHNYFDAKVRITKDGALGTSQFQFSLDGGETWSPELKTTASYVIPSSNLTVAMSAGSHTAGSVAHNTFTPAMPNATDLGNCFAALESQTSTPTLILVAAEGVDPEQGAALFAPLDVALTELNSKYKYTQAVLPVGGESKLSGRTVPTAGEFTTGDVLTETAPLVASVGNIISVVAERASVSHPLPKMGYSLPRLPFGYVVAAEAHAVGRDISKLLADPLSYASKPSYDDFANGTVYSPEKIVAPRTWPGEGGIFLNQFHLKSAPTSTYDIWPKGRVANRAAEVLKLALRPFINQRVRVLTDGTGRINPVDKAAIEGTVNAALRDALLNVQNGQGFLGHVSGLLFTVNGENNLLSTGLLQTTCQIVPLGYIKDIDAVITLENEIPVSAQ